MAREQLKNLTEPMYYILLSLLQENHGYGIMQMVDELTEGRVQVGAGTLYSLLGRFEKEDIIVQVAEENRRKIYKITAKGEELLRTEYARLNHLVEDGKKFFEFKGDRKEPPTGGGDGEEKEVIKAADAAVPEVQAESKKKTEKERGGFKLPQGGWNYGGGFHPA